MNTNRISRASLTCLITLALAAPVAGADTMMKSKEKMMDKSMEGSMTTMEKEKEMSMDKMNMEKEKMMSMEKTKMGEEKGMAMEKSMDKSMEKTMMKEDKGGMMGDKKGM